ncbi:hypothetical protein J7355_13585 [Endozoicomonas sp. G2_2]|uniref:hypothetical protein n=1 Tax=Endozoicomonas sp. G2_2 TaxID=2821092 RepID=UPI001ADB5626|nr:hypothetical protein [Endozoicomonas sp. G2_2]MBO9471128.1 hypothetical protein [Endozoicomonas sp. G2_2]
MDAIVTTAILILAVIFAASWLRRDARRDTTRQLRQRFGVSRRSQILARDVGPGGQANAHPRLLHADGMTGAPDVLFRDRKKLIAGEYKARRVKAGVRRRELYQITLYLGMLKSLYPAAKVEGRLVYHDCCKRVRFDPKLYAWLLTKRAGTLEILNQAGR